MITTTLRYSGVVEALRGPPKGLRPSGGASCRRDRGTDPSATPARSNRLTVPASRRSSRLGRAVGYAVTCEVTPMDSDSAAIPWAEHQDVLDETAGPIVAVYKDVDTRPGRAASFGDGMAATHKMLGVTGVLVDGSIRDLEGIRTVGMPIWATGQVPGHGVFSLVRVNSSVTVAGLRISPGELIVADSGGVTKIPEGIDAAEVLEAARRVRDFEASFHKLFDDPNVDLAKVREWLSTH